MSLPILPPPCPPSFAIWPNYVSSSTAEQLAAKISSSPLPKWRALSNRRLQIWGGTPTPQGMIPEPLPEWTAALCAQLGDLGLFGAGTPPNHILINEYLSGQGILAHTDGPLYHPTVATLSIGSTCVLEFDFGPEEEGGGESCSSLFWTAPDGSRYPKSFAVFVPANSLYAQLDPLYSRYLHGIAERTADRLDDYCTSPEDYAAQDTSGPIKRLLLNPQSWTGEPVVERGTRISLTFRVVKKVLKAGALKGLFGKR